MSVNIYNIRNHKLNGEVFRRLNYFTSDNYAGAIRGSETKLFSKSGNKVSIASSALVSDSILYLVGGGCVVSVDKADIERLTLSANKYYYVEVDLSAAVIDKDNVISNTSSGAKISTISYTSLPAEITTYLKTNQTIWNGNIFKIPLFYTNASVNVVSVLANRSKSSLESYLTQQAIDSFWATAHKTFTHQGGSGATDPNNPNRDTSTDGKLGNFNFSGSKVTHKNSALISVDGDNAITIASLDTGVVTAASGKLSTVKSVPIANGGTGATTKQNAKKNLGIYYGTANPNITAPTTKPVIGDLYFKILT